MSSRARRFLRKRARKVRDERRLAARRDPAREQLRRWAEKLGI